LLFCEFSGSHIWIRCTETFIYHVFRWNINQLVKNLIEIDPCLSWAWPTTNAIHSFITMDQLQTLNCVSCCATLKANWDFNSILSKALSRGKYELHKKKSLETIFPFMFTMVTDSCWCLIHLHGVCYSLLININTYHNISLFKEMCFAWPILSHVQCSSMQLSFTQWPTVLCTLFTLHNNKYLLSI